MFRQATLAQIAFGEPSSSNRGSPLDGYALHTRLFSPRGGRAPLLARGGLRRPLRSHSRRIRDGSRTPTAVREVREMRATPRALRGRFRRASPNARFRHRALRRSSAAGQRLHPSSRFRRIPRGAPREFARSGPAGCCLRTLPRSVPTTTRRAAREPLRGLRRSQRGCASARGRGLRLRAPGAPGRPAASGFWSDRSSARYGSSTLPAIRSATRPRPERS